MTKVIDRQGDSRPSGQVHDGTGEPLVQRIQCRIRAKRAQPVALACLARGRRDAGTAVQCERDSQRPQR